MAKVTPRIQAGFMELLPGEQILFNKYLRIIKDAFEEFGFVPQETPMVENADVLFAQIGEDTKKEIYRFTKGDDDLGLRFDLTVPLARYVAMYYNKLSFPFRRYQIGKVYRGERPQKGRFREFYQCDIDMIGNGNLSLINDAEIPAVINRVFEKLDLGEFIVYINNRKILSGLVDSMGCLDKIDEVLRAIDKWEKVGQETVRLMLVEDLNMKAANVDKIIKFVKITGSNKQIVAKLESFEIKNELFDTGVAELKEVVEKALDFGVPEKNLQIDLAIARGLSYYTGTVYETKLLDDRIRGSVCGGGRFDNLADCYTNQRLPGVGVSIGLTRLFSELISAGIIKVETSTVAKVLVIPMDKVTEFSLKIASEMRLAGIPVELFTEEDKFRKKLTYANKLGVPFIAIIGDEEEKTKRIALKDMKTGEQELVDVKTAIRKILGNG